jgi:hypothetical protein
MAGQVKSPREKAGDPLPPRHRYTKANTPATVADTLRPWLVNRPAGEPVWPGVWWKRSAQMLRHDLKAAGIQYKDEEGRVFDFHAQRGAYITSLVTSGASPKEAQLLARHSKITQTMDGYCRLTVTDVAGAIEALPDLTRGSGN